MKNIFNWVEIPANNFARAIEFYKEIFGFEKMESMQMGGADMAFFPMESQEGTGGAIVFGEGYIPTDKGIQVYFDCGDDLQPVLDKVKSAGGNVIIPKTLIRDDIGYFAKMIDSEGNVVNLHSRT